ncbi:AMP-binding protein [Actinosynnema sp. NPDC053489]|uniref:AMP-binding protein n=1 Tax=Actinosynnema sp. NPDC053489 TaxID=3363916 RepID=UPI0037C5B3E1
MPSSRLPGHLADHAVNRSRSVALVGPDRELTYGELSGLAERYAADLAALGVTPDRPVCVPAHKSVETVALLIACFTAGTSVLVPSSGLGPEALRTVCAQARCSHVLTADPGGRPVAAAVDGPAPEGFEPVDPRRTEVVFTTSGSTGTPKVVPVPESAFDRFAEWATVTAPVREEDLTMAEPTAAPDGWGARARIGVVVPHADVGPESEMQALAPRDVVVHGSRVHFGAMRAGGVMDPKIPHAPVRAFVEPPHVDTAVELLAAAPLDVIAFGFTSSAYVLGAAGEKDLFDRPAGYARGLPVTGTAKAAVAGFEAPGARRVAIVDPSWFDDDLSGLGARYFAEHGFEVVRHGPCGLPSDQELITPEALAQWVRTEVAAAGPDAVLVAGNGIRAVVRRPAPVSPLWDEPAVG